MEFAKQLWQTYLREHAPAGMDPEIEMLRGDDALSAIWWFADELSERKFMLSEVSFDASFDDEADGALANIALTGDRKSLDFASIGAWRVLEGRWLWFITAMMAAELKGAGASIPVPRYGSAELRGTASLLIALGGHARDVPPQLQTQGSRGQLASLLASKPAWRQ